MVHGCGSLPECTTHKCMSKSCWTCLEYMCALRQKLFLSLSVCVCEINTWTWISLSVIWAHLSMANGRGRQANSVCTRRTGILSYSARRWKRICRLARGHQRRRYNNGVCVWLYEGWRGEGAVHACHIIKEKKSSYCKHYSFSCFAECFYVWPRILKANSSTCFQLKGLNFLKAYHKFLISSVLISFPGPADGWTSPRRDAATTVLHCGHSVLRLVRVFFSLPHALATP